jgi:hypothetical protein
VVFLEANLPFIVVKYDQVLLSGHANPRPNPVKSVYYKFVSMSRTEVTFPPEMLPKAEDPETAQVILCPSHQAAGLAPSPLTAYQLSRLPKLH